MSIQQLSKFLNDQNEFRNQARGCSRAVFLQYDYSESQQVFKDKFPSSNFSALGGLKDWEWFIDEKSKPNIRPSFYNQRLHIPMGPVPTPATRIEQYESEMPIAVLGFLYTLSFEELNALAQEQSLEDRQQFYVPVQIQSRSINGFDTKMILATIFVDIATTRGGSIDLTNESTNLKWVTAIKRMELIGMSNWYVTSIEAKLRGWDKRVEPLLVRFNPNPTIDPRAAQRQAALISNARLKQQQKQHQQQEDQQGRQKQKKVPSRPMITISQRQRDSMLQRILSHGMISSEAMLKLTELQKTLMVDTYLRKQQKAIYVRDKAEKKRLEEASQVSAPSIRIPGQQGNSKAPAQQTTPREEAILNDIIRKQKDAVREQDSRESSRMLPPPPPVRRYSQSSPGKGQAQAQSQAQNGNSRPPTQLNYPQNPNNLKRQASNSISTAIGTPDAKRQNTGNTSGKKGGSQNSNGNNGELKDPTSNPNAKKNSSDAQEAKPKTRGRPRKSRAKVPPTGDSNNLDQDGQNSQAAGNSMDSGGKIHTNANVKGNAMSRSQAQAAPENLNQVANGNGTSNAYSNGNLNTQNRSQALPHVEQAAKMVDYFQPKANGEKAGDGRLQ
ncbi:hypothetical protein BPAE_0245g00070 [Botrytis paeoniae]|uniref:Uncharacterized protein n=1 Tax=Botrytis paeoniae TaxID=278948 RepID=A0A4Z1FHF9_9HELO|nr:hypothetical protein BPAE_0245g00070 [Botrytis paeoniae]